MTAKYSCIEGKHVCRKNSYFEEQTPLGLKMAGFPFDIQVSAPCVRDHLLKSTSSIQCKDLTPQSYRSIANNSFLVCSLLLHALHIESFTLFCR